jgi:hypothetical protein
MPEPKTIAVYADSRGSGTCRGCEERITWAETLKGKRMPFDGSPVALRTEHDAGTHRLIEHLPFEANHWATCRARDQFKRR